MRKEAVKRTLSEKERKELLREYRINGNLNAREILIKENIELVYSVAHRFKSSHNDFQDLSQIGVIGLIKAIDNFDLNYDVTLSTYAIPMITGEIRRYLRDLLSEKIQLLKNKKSAWVLSLRYGLVDGREWTQTEVAETLNISQAQVSRIEIAAFKELHEFLSNDEEIVHKFLKH